MILLLQESTPLFSSACWRETICQSGMWGLICWKTATLMFISSHLIRYEIHCMMNYINDKGKCSIQKAKYDKKPNNKQSGAKWSAVEQLQEYHLLVGQFGLDPIWLLGGTWPYTLNVYSGYGPDAGSFRTQLQSLITCWHSWVFSWNVLSGVDFIVDLKATSVIHYERIAG